jgi:hypothetical protein
MSDELCQASSFGKGEKVENYITQSCALSGILNNAQMLVTKNKKPQTINLFT